MTTYFSGDSNCKECASCGPSDYVVDIVIMEHGFQGEHTNLNAIASSIVKNFDARHNCSLWRHVCPYLSESTRSSSRLHASANSSHIESQQQNCMNLQGQREGFRMRSSSSPSCRCSSGYHRAPFSASPAADILLSPTLPLCPHHLLILNDPENDGWKSLWSVQKCSARLISFVLEKIVKYLAELESTIRNSSQHFARMPYSTAKSKKVKNLSCLPSSDSSEVCDLGNAFLKAQKSEKWNPENEENDPERKRKTFSVSSLPLSNGVPTESVEGTASASFSSRIKIKLIFHFVGFSMGGIILRAAMPALMKKIEKKYLSTTNSRYNKDDDSLLGCFCSGTVVDKSNRRHSNILTSNTLSEEGKDATGQRWVSEITTEYNILWKSYFSLSSPHLGSRIPHPRWKKTYQLVDRLKKLLIVPSGVLDLLLRSSYLEKELLKPDYLHALKKIEKKYFLGSLNDPTVWNYSSCFLLPPLERFILEGWIPAGVHTTILHVKVHQSMCRQRAEKRRQSREARRHEMLSNLESNSAHAVEKSSGSSETQKRRKHRIHSKEIGSPRKLISQKRESCFSSENSPVNSEDFSPDSYSESYLRYLQKDSCSLWLNYSGEEDAIRTRSRRFFPFVGLRTSSNISELLSNGVTLLDGNVEVNVNHEKERGVSPAADGEQDEMGSKQLFRIVELPPKVEAVASLPPERFCSGSFSSFSESPSRSLERTSAPVRRDRNNPIYPSTSLPNQFLRTDTREKRPQGSWVSEERWPAKYLPRERRMAETFLKGIGSIEVHLLDMQRAADLFLDSLVLSAMESNRGNDINFDLLLYVLTLVYGNAHCAVLSDENGSGSVPPRYSSSFSSVHCKEKSSRKCEFSSVSSGRRNEMKGSPQSSLVAYEHQEEKVVLPFNYPSEFIAFKILEGDR